MSTDTKTIHEFLADNPNVDVSKAWERCFGILAGYKDQIAAKLDVTRHPSCAGREFYTSPDGAFEGSFNAYSGSDCEWLVNSWLGNRKASILDMNATCFLSQDTDVPHLLVIYGTLPELFFCADYIPRRDLMTNTDYLDKYYDGEVNQDFLKIRGDKDLKWLVSHGPYMRAMMSPVAMSMTGELNTANIDKFQAYSDRFVSRWLGWLDTAEPVPEAQRAELQRYDHRVRTLGYTRDPMNSLAEKVFGADQVENMVRMRMGADQMDASRKY